MADPVANPDAAALEVTAHTTEDAVDAVVVAQDSNTLRISGLYKTKATNDPYHKPFDVISRNMPMSFTISGWKYANGATCSSLTFSVKSQHKMSYRGVDYVFDIDDMGSMTVPMSTSRSA